MGGLRPLHSGMDFRFHEAHGDGVELSQGIWVLEYQIAQLLPIQTVRAEHVSEPFGQGGAQGLAGLDELVIDHVAVQNLHIHFRQHMQGAGLSGAGAAGDANDLHRMLSLSFQIHHMEPRRLFQPVPDGQTQPGIVRALGIDLRHVRVVKLPQGVKDPPRLLRLVPFRPQAVGNAIGKQLRILVKADDTSAGCDLLSNICRRLCSVTSEDGDFGVRGIVAVLHPWGTGLFIGLQLAGHRVVYRDLPHHPF